MKKIIIGFIALTAISSYAQAEYQYQCDEDGNCKWVYIYR